MPVDTYAEWIADGQPWRPSVPVADLSKALRGHGYVVYILGDDSHLKRRASGSTVDGSGAQDHAPYSHTPWPDPQPYPHITAEDIMPPPPGSALPSLAQLGAQIYADKQAGHPGVAWIKYMNWEPSGPGGPCYQDSWKPDHARTSSGDRGHIHLSGRTDLVRSTAAADYDPVARIQGDDMTPDELLNTALAGGITVRNALYSIYLRTPSNLAARLDQILAAAIDDDNTSVAMTPQDREALAAQLAQVLDIPTAEENATATDAKIATRFQE